MEDVVSARPTVSVDHDEVHLAAVHIAKVAQLDIAAFGVLPEVHPLEQVRPNEVLEALRSPGDDGPVQITLTDFGLHSCHIGNHPTK